MEIYNFRDILHPKVEAIPLSAEVTREVGKLSDLYHAVGDGVDLKVKVEHGYAYHWDVIVDGVVADFHFTGFNKGGEVFRGAEEFVCFAQKRADKIRIVVETPADYRTETEEITAHYGDETWGTGRYMTSRTNYGSRLVAVFELQVPLPEFEEADIVAEGRTPSFAYCIRLANSEELFFKETLDQWERLKPGRFQEQDPAPETKYTPTSKWEEERRRMHEILRLQFIK
jgi:hypothetical protein